MEEGERLENLQCDLARIICGTKKPEHVGHAALYTEIGWETLKSRREVQSLVMLYKIMNNLGPLNLPRTTTGENTG